MLNVNLFHQDGPKVFPCPACGEETHTGLDKCPSCGASLDVKASAAAAESESKLSTAFSDGAVVRMVGGGAFSFTLIGNFFLLRLGFAGRSAGAHGPWALAMILAAVSLGIIAVTVLLAVRWFARFGLLRFDKFGDVSRAKMEQDYRQSRSYISQGLSWAAVAFAISAVSLLLYSRLDSRLR